MGETLWRIFSAPISHKMPRDRLVVWRLNVIASIVATNITAFTRYRNTL